jgi:hypothetical protein
LELTERVGPMELMFVGRGFDNMVRRNGLLEQIWIEVQDNDTAGCSCTVD